MHIFTKKFRTLDLDLGPSTHSLGQSPKKNVFFYTFLNLSQVQTNGKHTFYLHESTVKAAKEVVMDRQVRSNLCTESLYHEWHSILLSIFAEFLLSLNL